ncbi:MAG: hypothetical protein IRZ18_02205 [Clostridia bacterium]|nr:hypothetical protein [Clostridia bacterium]
MRSARNGGARAWQAAVAVGSVFAGGVVGAGFASGRELWQFFAAYGPVGVVAAALSGLGFAVAAAFVVAALRLAPGGAAAAGHHDLLRALPPFAARALDVLFTLFLFVGLAVVLSGAGALLEEQWAWPYTAGVASLAAPVAAALLARERGFVWANTALTPLLVVLMLALFARLLAATPGPAPAPVPDPAQALPAPWWWAALLYVAYNMLVGVVAIASLEPARLASRGAYAGAAAGGLALGLLAAAGTAVLVQQGARAASFDVPFAALARHLGAGWSLVYSAALYAALATTALANARGLAARFSGARPGQLDRLLPCLWLLAALPFTRFGLSWLVRVVYPAAGYASLALLLALPLIVLRRWLDARAG